MLQDTKFYTIDEVAKRYGFNYLYFSRLVKSGKIPCHRFGERKFLFTDEDLKDYEDSCKVR